MDSDQSQHPWEVQESAFPSDASLEEQAQFLLRYAILAPSSHNSQPWEFAVDGHDVQVFVDESRWLTVADSDKRELYFSVGCAIENLAVAAAHFGFETAVEYVPDADPSLAAIITLRRSDSTTIPSSDQFPAITERRTNHNVFEDRALSTNFRERLDACLDESGAELLQIEDKETRAAVAELQTRADERQFDDPAYRAELGHWIGSGALGATWLTARIGQLAVTHLDLGEREGVKNSKLIRSAPTVAVLATNTNDRASQVRAGRMFERVSLLATTEGVAVHPMNQILQVPELKAELGDLLDAPDRSFQLLFRLGHAPPESKRRPRRPMEAVLRQS